MTGRAGLGRTATGVALLCLAVLPSLVAWGLGEGTAGAEGLGGRSPSPRPVVVVDGAGRLVGRVVGEGQFGGAVVWVRAGGRDLVLEVRLDELVPPFGNLVVVFEADNCTGPAWLLTGFGAPVAPLFEVGAVGPGHVVFVPDGPLETKTIASGWQPRFNENEPCVVVPAPEEHLVQPGVATLDLDDWTPPFSLR